MNQMSPVDQWPIRMKMHWFHLPPYRTHLHEQHFLWKQITFSSIIVMRVGESTDEQNAS